MATNISISLDVKKIDKDRLYVGEKGIYLDAAIIMYDEPNQFGHNGMIVQNVTDEERKAGIKGAILGNVRYIVKKEKTPEEKADELGDLPF